MPLRHARDRMKPAPLTHSTETISWLVARGVLRVVLIVTIGALGIIVVPRLLGLAPLGVQGGSMGDALPHGSLVFTSTVAPDEVELGDIVVLRNAPGRPQIIHRVVEISTETGQRLVTTRGDANNASDPEPFVLRGPVTVPTLALPYLGFLLIFIATPLGWLLAIALPASSVTFLAIREIWRDAEDGHPGGLDATGHWTERYDLPVLAG
ncbi:MAG: signal peptidase I [Gaiellaceae bacterium]